MQQRVVELISRVSNEEVTEELLHVNDDLNNIFLRYERYDQTKRQSDLICVVRQGLAQHACFYYGAVTVIKIHIKLNIFCFHVELDVFAPVCLMDK